jgi:hypothetical protein
VNTEIYKLRSRVKSNLHHEIHYFLNNQVLSVKTEKYFWFVNKNRKKEM